MCRLTAGQHEECFVQRAQVREELLAFLGHGPQLLELGLRAVSPVFGLDADVRHPQEAAELARAPPPECRLQRAAPSPSVKQTKGTKP
eukprot:3235010-Pyramimonas_sp.AAC.1